MKTILVALILALIATSAMATTVVLTWDKTTDTTVTGQKVYYDSQCTPQLKGTTATQGASGYLVANGTGTTISGLLSTSPWCFAVTNVNAANMESVLSNIVTVPAFPAAPSGVKFISVGP